MRTTEGLLSMIAAGSLVFSLAACGDGSEGGNSAADGSDDQSPSLAEVHEERPPALNSSGAVVVNSSGAMDPVEEVPRQRMDIFFDPACPACHEAEDQLSETWRDILEEDGAVMFSHPVSFLAGEYSRQAAGLLVAVAENTPEKYLDVQYALVDSQNADQISSDEDFVELLVRLDIPEDEAEESVGMMDEYGDWVVEHTHFVADRAELQGDDSFSIPMITVGGEYSQDALQDAHHFEPEEDVKSEFQSFWAEHS